DALRFGKRPNDALARYRQGLAVSVPAQEWSACLTLLTRAGETCLELEDWAEAEGYFSLATDVAAKLLNATALCDSHEQCGVAQAAQHDHEGAARSWVTAKDFSKRYGYLVRFTSAIDRLIALYEQASLPKKVDALQAERAAGVAGGAAA
ncbi:MAG: hypothetical protein JKX97_09165, partial [Candidatus Lindowbacteria bacterium]|nr:hypothetical protein [Candidatus Lindowbacteria bacterium]